MKKPILFITTLLCLLVQWCSILAQKYIESKPGNIDSSIKVWNEFPTNELPSPETFPGASVSNLTSYLKVSGLTPSQYYSYRKLYGIKNTVIIDNYDEAYGNDSYVKNSFMTSNASFKRLVAGRFHATGNQGQIYGVRGEAYIENNTSTTSASYIGVYGAANAHTKTSSYIYGIYGTAVLPLELSNPIFYPNAYAGYFDGKVHVNGTLSKSAGTFKIDHPIDPENKYLSHSFVESPDMMNIYNGNVTTDQNGKAIVTLPSYFESLNLDFRYQLTAIGLLCQVAVLEEIKNNQFTIITEKPNVKVSWQVTGIRNDAYAKKNRTKVEEDKPKNERGKFLNPEAFGLKKEDAIHYVKHEKNN